jgi:phosphatidylinositol alpha-mannosyltransferase
MERAAFRGGGFLRIGVVTQPYYPQTGGVSENVHHTAIELRKLGHEIDIITSRFAGYEEDSEGVIRLGRNILVPSLGALSNVNGDPSVGREVERVLRRNEYDLIHIHEPLSPTLPLAAISSAPADTPLVGTFHACARGMGWYRLFGRLLLRYASRLDSRIAVSRAARNYAARFMGGQYAIIPNGVDPHRFHPKNPPLEGLESASPTILFVGRFYPRKGFQVLMSALPQIVKRVPDVRVLVVGDGPLAPWYRAQARRAPCEVRFLGELTFREIPRAFCTGDVLVAPSTAHESFGIIHLEAMASGIPIVASDIEGYREILDSGREAILFPNGDAESLAGAVIQVLTNEALARDMGALGRKKAERYSWPGIVRELEAHFSGLLRHEQRIPLAS